MSRRHRRRPHTHPFRQNHPRQLHIPYGDVARFCRRWGMTELALFGSVLRADFHPESDVDMLATFAPNTQHTLFDLVEMESQLSDIIGRRVDLGERSAVESDTNLLRRQSILSTLKVIYEDRPRTPNRHAAGHSADSDLHGGHG